MPRKKVSIESPGPYHISHRTINQEWFNIPMPEVWEIFSTFLPLLNFAFDFEIHSFVLMNNHYHLIVSTPLCNLTEGMTYFGREVSRELNRKGNRINRTFASRYFKTHLKKYHYFLNCYKYVYQNPVRAGITSNCENYPYSTLNGLIGINHLQIPLAEDTILFDGNINSCLQWLNTPARKIDLESMRTALKHGEYKLRKDPNTKQPNRLEDGYI